MSQINPEDRPAVYEAIRTHCLHHPDMRVRMHTAFVMMGKRQVYTSEDVTAWLSDNSDEVRLAAVFYLYCEEYPDELEAPYDDRPPHETARHAQQLASAMIRHLDDTNIHVASHLLYALSYFVYDFATEEQLVASGAPAFWERESEWIYLSWRDRRDGKQEIQQWWDNGGSQAFLDAATQHIREAQTEVARSQAR